jgi:hypothetical protein
MAFSWGVYQFYKKKRKGAEIQACFWGRNCKCQNGQWLCSAIHISIYGPKGIFFILFLFFQIPGIPGTRTVRYSVIVPGTVRYASVVPLCEVQAGSWA